MNKPHKHCEVIKERADDREIQWWDFNLDRWGDSNSPSFREDQRYRIKPEPKKIYLRLRTTSKGAIKPVYTMNKEGFGDCDYSWISDWVEIELYSKDEEE